MPFCSATRLVLAVALPLAFVVWLTLLPYGGHPSALLRIEDDYAAGEWETLLWQRFDASAVSPDATTSADDDSRLPRALSWCIVATALVTALGVAPSAHPFHLS